MTDPLELVDVAEDGQLSIGVAGEQMPLDGLAPAPSSAGAAVRDRPRALELEQPADALQLCEAGPTDQGPNG